MTKKREEILNEFIENTKEVIDELNIALSKAEDSLQYKTEEATDSLKRVNSHLQNTKLYINKWIN